MPSRAVKPRFPAARWRTGRRESQGYRARVLLGLQPGIPGHQPGRREIYSNTDRLELYVGGQHFATVLPDSTDYPDLKYPPSFADFGQVDGSSRPDLRIDGYLGQVKVASRSFRRPAIS